MKCLTPDCQSEKIYARGVCRRCYDRLQTRVRRGTATWSELVDQGFATKAQRRGCSSRQKQGSSNSLDAMLKKYATIYLDRGYVIEGETMTDEQRVGYEQILGG